MSPLKRMFSLVTAALVLSPLGVSAFTFTRSLDIGSQGADVIALQDILREQGYFTASSTGYFGPLTAKAVAEFQKVNALEIVGRVGPVTREVLNTLDSAQAQTSPTNASSSTKPLIAISLSLLTATSSRQPILAGTATGVQFISIVIRVPSRSSTGFSEIDRIESIPVNNGHWSVILPQSDIPSPSVVFSADGTLVLPITEMYIDAIASNDHYASGILPIIEFPLDLSTAIIPSIQITALYSTSSMAIISGSATNTSKVWIEFRELDSTQSKNYDVADSSVIDVTDGRCRPNSNCDVGRSS